MLSVSLMIGIEYSTSNCRQMTVFLWQVHSLSQGSPALCPSDEDVTRLTSPFPVSDDVTWRLGLPGVTNVQIHVSQTAQTTEQAIFCGDSSRVGQLHSSHSCCAENKIQNSNESSAVLPRGSVIQNPPLIDIMHDNKTVYVVLIWTIRT